MDIKKEAPDEAPSEAKSEPRNVEPTPRNLQPDRGRVNSHECECCNGGGCHECGGSGQDPAMLLEFMADMRGYFEAHDVDAMQFGFDLHITIEASVQATPADDIAAWGMRLKQALRVASADLTTREGYDFREDSDDPAHVTIVHFEFGGGLDVAAEIHLDDGRAYLTPDQVASHHPLVYQLEEHGFALCLDVTPAPCAVEVAR